MNAFFSLVPIYKKWFYIQYILGRTTEIYNLFEYVKLISGNFSFTNHDIINDVLKFLNEKHFFIIFFPRITIVKLIKQKKTRKEIYNSLLLKINKIIISFHIFDNITCLYSSGKSFSSSLTPWSSNTLT